MATPARSLPRRVEPGPGQESVWDYPRPPLLERSDRRVRVEHAGIVFDPAARTVAVDGEYVALSAKALAIIEALLERPGMPLSRERLEQLLYGWGEGVESNAVEVHIHHLRKKLGKERIRTIRGLGYMIPKP